MSIARAAPLLVKELVVVVVMWGERRWLMALVGLGRPSTDPGGYKTEIELCMSVMMMMMVME